MPMLDPSVFDPATFAPGGAFANGLPGWLTDALQVPMSRKAPQQPFGALAPAPPQQDDAALPPNAAPTSAIPPPALAPGMSTPGTMDAGTPAAPQASLLDRLGNGITDNSSMLMALGAGLAGAPSIGAGISRGLTGAAQGAQVDQQNQFRNQTVKALIAKGLSPDMAATVATNPEILKQLVPQLFGPKQSEWKQIGEDMLGNKTFGWVDQVARKAYDIAGNPIGTDANGAPTAGAPGTGLLAPGVKAPDSTLKGDDYLAQFSPEVQAAVKNYVDGKSMPTGNPRKGFTQTIKMIAQKYGEDTGNPTSDETFFARKQFRTGLSQTSPSSPGGQRNTASTAIGHLSEVSDLAAGLDNWDAGVPFASYLANATRQNLSTDQAAKVNALQDAVQRYSAEITKFYAGTAGGEHEREAAIARLNSAKSPKELAAAIETERNLMQGKLSQLETQKNEILGPSGGDLKIVTDKTQKYLDHIDENVKTMRGLPAAGGIPIAAAATGGAPMPMPGAPAAAATAPSPAVATPGLEAPPPMGATPALPKVTSFEQSLKLPKGTHFLDPNGVERIR